MGCFFVFARALKRNVQTRTWLSCNFLHEEEAFRVNLSQRFRKVSLRVVTVQSLGQR